MVKKLALLCAVVLALLTRTARAGCEMKEGDTCSFTNDFCPDDTFCYDTTLSGGTGKCTKKYQAAADATCATDEQCKLGLYCDQTSKKCTARKTAGSGGCNNGGCFGKYFCDRILDKCLEAMSVDDGGAADNSRQCKPGLALVSGKCAKITTQAACAGLLVRGWCAADSTCLFYDCAKEYQTNAEMSEDQVNQDFRKQSEAYYAYKKCTAKASGAGAPPNSMSPILIAMIAVAGAMFLCALTMTSMFMLARRRAALATAGGNAKSVPQKDVDGDEMDAEDGDEEPDLVDDGSETKA